MRDGFLLTGKPRGTTVYYYRNNIFFHDYRRDILYFENIVLGHAYISPNYFFMMKKQGGEYVFYSLKNIENGKLQFTRILSLPVKKNALFLVSYGINGIFVHHEPTVYYITPQEIQKMPMGHHLYGFARPRYCGYSHVSDGEYILTEDFGSKKHIMDYIFRVEGRNYVIKKNERGWYNLVEIETEKTVFSDIYRPTVYYIEEKMLMLHYPPTDFLGPTVFLGEKLHVFREPVDAVIPCFRLRFLEM